MNKITLVLVVSVTVILVAYGGWVLLSPKTSTPTQQAPSVTTLPQAAPAVPSTTGTAQNGATQTKDFLKDKDVSRDPANTGYYFLGNSFFSQSGSTSAGAPPYVIEYISQTQYFNIAILSEPIGTVRSNMEQYLMAKLGLSQSQMCQLDYMVTVPVSVNAYYAGNSLGFSFCPGAIVLPK